MPAERHHGAIAMEVDDWIAAFGKLSVTTTIVDSSGSQKLYLDTHSALAAPRWPVEKLSRYRTAFFSKSTRVPPLCKQYKQFYWMIIRYDSLLWVLDVDVVDAPVEQTLELDVWQVQPCVLSNAHSNTLITKASALKSRFRGNATPTFVGWRIDKYVSGFIMHSN